MRRKTAQKLFHCLSHLTAPVRYHVSICVRRIPGTTISLKQNLGSQRLALKGRNAERPDRSSVLSAAGRPRWCFSSVGTTAKRIRPFRRSCRSAYRAARGRPLRLPLFLHKVRRLTTAWVTGRANWQRSEPERAHAIPPYPCCGAASMAQPRCSIFPPARSLR